MMLKEESKKQLITRATQYGVDPKILTPVSGNTMTSHQLIMRGRHGLRKLAKQV